MHIHCDGTYKWIWQGHTLIVGGTTDKAPIRRMHQQEWEEQIFGNYKAKRKKQKETQ